MGEVRLEEGDASLGPDGTGCIGLAKRCCMRFAVMNCAGLIYVLRTLSLGPATEGVSLESCVRQVVQIGFQVIG